MSSALFTVELTEAQLLHAWCQAQNALGQTFKDIERGRCTEADATVERELYSVLSKAVYARSREPLGSERRCSMSHYEPSVSLHQQDGGITVQAFAEQHGIALAMMRRHVKAGRVIGARQDSRSRKWTIYPPAKLVDGSYRQQRKAAAVVDVGTSPHGLSAGLSLSVQETRETSSLTSPAKPVLNSLCHEGKLL